MESEVIMGILVIMPQCNIQVKLIVVGDSWGTS